MHIPISYNYQPCSMLTFDRIATERSGIYQSYLYSIIFARFLFACKPNCSKTISIGKCILCTQEPLQALVAIPRSLATLIMQGAYRCLSRGALSIFVVLRLFTLK